MEPPTYAPPSDGESPPAPAAQKSALTADGAVELALKHLARALPSLAPPRPGGPAAYALFVDADEEGAALVGPAWQPSDLAGWAPAAVEVAAAAFAQKRAGGAVIVALVAQGGAPAHRCVFDVPHESPPCAARKRAAAGFYPEPAEPRRASRPAFFPGLSVAARSA